jgi:hypothetical protein
MPQFKTASRDWWCWPGFGYKDFPPKKRAPKPKPLPKPKIKLATVSAVREILTLDCRETNTPPMPYGKWKNLLAWKYRNSAWIQHSKRGLGFGRLVLLLVSSP